jgi:hypothetical protein
VQVLEGQRDKVWSRFKKIEQDSRHSDGSCPWEWCKSDVVVLSPARLAG